MSDLSLSSALLFPDQLVAAHSHDMATRGYSVVPEVLEPSACERLRTALAKAVADYRPGPTEQSKLDRYLIHDLLCRDRMFAALIEDPRLQQLLAPLLGASWVLYSFTSSSLPPQGTNYGNRIHVDSPRFVAGYPFNIGVMWALDDFTPKNGATQLLPGSHHSDAVPDTAYFDRHCVQISCAKGSMIVFNARVFHRAAENSTGEWRHALTMNACRSFMKQRFDWVRFIPTEISGTLSPQARRVIGFDTRVPTSLEEFFLPEDQRLYKPGQG